MVQIISAGAGSGKTYRLNQELVARIRSGETRITGLFATTFTLKAATELKERVRMSLLENDMLSEAQELSGALIGTVHELGVKLIKRFAYSGGLSPQVNIISDDDRKRTFNQSLSHILAQGDTVEEINALCIRLGLSRDAKEHDWRNDILNIVDVLRGNFFGDAVIQESKQKSVASLLAILPKADTLNALFNDPKLFYKELNNFIVDTLTLLNNSEDTTKDTKDAIKLLRQTLNDIKFNGFLPWSTWAKLCTIKVGAKSKSYILPLIEFANQHTQFPNFHADIQNYIEYMFDIGAKAIEEYQNFKKKRGLIDYTDMEVEILRLISMPHIADILKSEIDLLLVDEFQDINPLQLDIFLKLSQLAKHSIWVGDPKQSIYSFRYAEPRLMRAVIDHFGITPENILSTSYRSRADIVNLSNALFLKAFEGQIPPEQIALAVNPNKKENSTQTHAIQHWHFNLDKGGNNRTFETAEWLTDCTAENIASLLNSDLQILPKGEKNLRTVRAGDVVVLCATNDACQKMATALYRVGISAAFPRSGLLKTPEIALISAILHFLLDRRDSLSVAEILFLTENFSLEDIARNRWFFLQDENSAEKKATWHADNSFVQAIDALRSNVMELSASEILDTVITQLDLRRRIAAWGNAEQRLQNIEMLRKLATDYEQHCKKMHDAASLNHFLQWLQAQARAANDTQSTGAGENAVNITTYHKSKGLEYPVVVLSSLDKKVRENIWGVNIEANSDAVDFDNILGNRFVRFWVNPYGNNALTHSPISEKLENSKEKLAATLSALEEEARLLYVGITRARDYLIFVSSQKDMPWLNRVWHNGDSTKPVLEVLSNETPFLHKGDYIIKHTVATTFAKDFGSVEVEKTNAFYTEPLEGKQNLAPRAIHASEPLAQFTPLKPIKKASASLYAPFMASIDDAVLEMAFTNCVAANHFLNTPWQPSASFAKHVTQTDEADFNAFVKTMNAVTASFKKEFSAFLNVLPVDLQFLNSLPLALHLGERVFTIDVPLVVHAASETNLIFFTDAAVDTVESLSNLTTLFLSFEAATKKYNSAVRLFLLDVKMGGMTEIAFEN